MKTLSLLCLLCVSVLSAEDRFAAISQDYHAQARLVDRLDGFVLSEVKIQDLDLIDALSVLQKLGSKEPENARGGIPGTGVINYVIRGNPSLPEEKEKVTVALNAESISFAAAVDAICKQAGYRWSVDLPKGVPYLEIRRTKIVNPLGESKSQ